MQAEEFKYVIAADNQLDQSEIITQLRDKNKRLEDENQRLKDDLAKATEENQRKDQATSRSKTDLDKKDSTIAELRAELQNRPQARQPVFQFGFSWRWLVAALTVLLIGFSLYFY